jgi:hypothetical protein
MKSCNVIHCFNEEMRERYTGKEEGVMSENKKEIIILEFH